MSEAKASHDNLAPYPLALVVCDGIWIDPYTGKKTLIGTFSALGGSEFPLRHPILAVYICLTDGHGQVRLNLQLIDVDEEREPIFDLKEQVRFDDPRAIVEATFHAAGIELPEPGEYRLKLFGNDEFLLERRILVFGYHDEENEDE